MCDCFSSYEAGWNWSPDGTKIVSGLTEDLSVIDIATGEETSFDGWLNASWQRIAAGNAPAPVPEPGLPSRQAIEPRDAAGTATPRLP